MGNRCVSVTMGLVTVSHGDIDALAAFPTWTYTDLSISARLLVLVMCLALHHQPVVIFFFIVK